MVGIDVLYLLDRLEELLAAGSRFPFTSKILIDEQSCLDILDQIRVAIPEEIKQAKRLNAEREALLAEARARATEVVSEAEARAAEKAREHSLARAAEARAAEILQAAEGNAEETRRGADDYAYQVLTSLENQLHSIAASVRKGMRALEAEGAGAPTVQQQEEDHSL